MASLFDKYIYQTYKGLIKTLDNEPIDGTTKPLSDGEGNELPIKVSDTDVEVGFFTSKNVFIEAYGEVISQNGEWTGPTQGLAGTSGTSGTNGAAGSSGTSGVNGSSGQSGSAGTSGTSGKNGTNGVSGTSGTSGVNGSSGATGSSGTSGTSGQNGSSGTSGMNGAAGSSGTSGTSGISQPGTPGTSGTSGTSGVSNDGTSGTSGTSGVDGISTGRVYFFNQSQNSDVSPYKVLSTEPSGAAQQIVAKTLTNNQTNVLVQEFITPELGFTIIPGGSQRFHLHFKKPASNDTIEAYATFELANSVGTSYGSIITTNTDLIGWVDATNPVEVLLDAVIPTTTILATDRMIVKIYLSNLDSTSHTVNFYTEGTSNYSYVTTSVAPTNGTSGTSGVNGTSGTSGANGSQGPQGPAGTSGTDGSSGTSGINGNAGTSGTSGTSGGGGSSADQFTSIRVPSTITGALPWYKLNVPAITFATTPFVFTAGTVRFTPVQCLLPGEVIKEVAINVTGVAQAGSTLTLGLYTCAVDANGNFYADTLVSNFGTVDTSTTGRKTITNINFTVPASTNNTYYIGMLQLGGTGSVNILGPQNGTSLCYYGSLNASSMDRPMSVTGSGGQTVLPTTISSTTWGVYVNATVYAYVGFKL